VKYPASCNGFSGTRHLLQPGPLYYQNFRLKVLQLQKPTAPFRYCSVYGCVYIALNRELDNFIYFWAISFLVIQEWLRSNKYFLYRHFAIKAVPTSSKDNATTKLYTVVGAVQRDKIF
jgi:hypothetical protein